MSRREKVLAILAQTRALVDELAKSTTFPCTYDSVGSCVRIQDTSARAAYDRYDPRAMCDACAAFWYADMAQITLGRVLRLVEE